MFDHSTTFSSSIIQRDVFVIYQTNDYLQKENRFVFASLCKQVYQLPLIYFFLALSLSRSKADNCLSLSKHAKRTVNITKTTMKIMCPEALQRCNKRIIQSSVGIDWTFDRSIDRWHIRLPFSRIISFFGFGVWQMFLALFVIVAPWVDKFDSREG